MCRIYLVCNKNRFIQGDPDQSLSLSTRHFNFSLNLFFHKFLRFIFYLFDIKSLNFPSSDCGNRWASSSIRQWPNWVSFKNCSTKKTSAGNSSRFFPSREYTKNCFKIVTFFPLHPFAQSENWLLGIFPLVNFRVDERENNKKYSKKQGHFKMFDNAHSITRQTCG